MPIPEAVKLILSADQNNILCIRCMGTGDLKRVRHECTFVGVGVCESCEGKGFLTPEDRKRNKAAKSSA